MSADTHDPRSRDNAAREFVSRLDASLASEHASAIPPGDDEIAAYVDGTLDDVAREIFETRLADDPALRGEVEGLRALKATLRSPARRGFGPASRPAAWMAAAATILVAAALIVLWSRPSPISLRDSGGLVVMHGNGTLEGFGTLSADLEGRVRETLRTGRLPISPGIDRVRVEERPLLSGDTGKSAFRVTRPTGTFVRGDRPVFQWSRLAAASGYRVSLYDEDLRLVAESALIETTEWTPPAALPRDVVLLWQVEATTPTGRVLTPSPPDRQARFRILSEADAQGLQNRLDRFGGSHVVRALILADAGLIDEARAEVDALKARNPDTSVVDSLLASLQ